MTRAPALSPEDSLVLRLGRGSVGPEDGDSARALLGRKLDWTSILARAGTHGVLPLLSRNLESLQFAGVPAPAQAALETARRLNGARNSLLVARLVHVLKLLGEAGIPVLPLKGVALAQSLYGDITLRTCADLDVLVPGAAVARAFDVLLANGYEHGEAEPVEASDVQLLLASNMEYTFVARDRSFSCPLELHWGIAWRWPRHEAALDDLWAQARPWSCWGAEAHGLSPEWQLLYLAVHATRHRWQGLQWLVDIHEVCLRGQLDWSGVRATAARFGWEEILRLTLGACQALLGTPIPADLSHGVLPRWMRLFPATPASASIWDDALFPARLFGRPGDKLSYLASLLVLPTLAERRLFRLPARLSPLYYLLRPLRLGGRWSWDLVSR